MGPSSTGSDTKRTVAFEFGPQEGSSCGGNCNLSHAHAGTVGRPTFTNTPLLLGSSTQMLLCIHDILLGDSRTGSPSRCPHDAVAKQAFGSTGLPSQYIGLATASGPSKP